MPMPLKLRWVLISSIDCCLMCLEVLLPEGLVAVIVSVPLPTTNTITAILEMPSRLVIPGTATSNCSPAHAMARITLRLPFLASLMTMLSFCILLSGLSVPLCVVIGVWVCLLVIKLMSLSLMILSEIVLYLSVFWFEPLFLPNTVCHVLC